MTIRRLDDLPDVRGKSVLVRATLDQTLGREPDHPLAALRLRRLAETVSYLTERGATVTVFGDAAHSAPPLGVQSVGDLETLIAGLGAAAAVGTADRSVEHPCVLEPLVRASDLFVNDSFQWSYLPLPSLLLPAARLVSVAGRGMEHDLQVAGGLLRDPARPYVAVLGGVNLLLRLHGLAGLILRCDDILVGGAMSVPLLEAVGRRPPSGLPPSLLDECRYVVGLADRVQHHVHLPVDLLVRSVDGSIEQVRVDERVEGEVIDIGPRTAVHFAEVVSGGDTVLWTGALGRVEEGPGRGASRAVSDALPREPGRRVVIGGESLVDWLWSEALLRETGDVVTATDSLLEMIKTGTLAALAPLG